MIWSKKKEEITAVLAPLKRNFYVSNKKIRKICYFIGGGFTGYGYLLPIRNDYGDPVHYYGEVSFYVLSLPLGTSTRYPALSRLSKVEFISESSLFETEKEAQMELIRIERFEGKPKK